MQLQKDLQAGAHGGSSIAELACMMRQYTINPCITHRPRSAMLTVEVGQVSKSASVTIPSHKTSNTKAAAAVFEFEM